MADRYHDRPYPDDDIYARGDDDRAPQRPAGSDPLAELARLIGQADPFAPAKGEPQAAAERRDHFPSDGPSADYDEPQATTPAWMRHRAPVADAYGAPHSADPYAPDPYAADPYADDGYDQPYEPQAPARQQAFRQDAHQHARQNSQQDQDLPYQDPRYDGVLYGEPERDPHHDAPFQVQGEERYDEYGRPYDDGQDDAPKPQRGGTMTVVVVLTLAVVGTAAAFGYRTFVGSPRSGEPPVIKADAGPNKIIPAGSADGSKQITDRLGDKPAERVVSREEQPVDINGKAQPRVVFPPLAQNSSPPNITGTSAAARPLAGPGNGTLGGDPPRKIRTLSIRPEGETAAAANTASTANASASIAPAPAVRQIPPAPRAAAAAPAASNGPIALTPQTSAPAPAPRVAAVAPSTPHGGGSYVQVSSQKTEADAQASFRAIQAKYSGIIGSKPSSIKRADLGQKGVFYRAMVGPFANAEEATQFCVNLKSAGGQCIVQR